MGRATQRPDAAAQAPAGAAAWTDNTRIARTEPRPSHPRKNSMAINSRIAWTEDTFNIAWGCVKVSPGCKNCYAAGLASRFGHDVWGPDKRRRTFGPGHWAEPVKWNAAAAAAGERRRVFCSS